MKTLLSCLLLVVASMSVQAAEVGPDSSWGQLYSSTFYRPLMPTVIFRAHSSNGVGSKWVFKKAMNVSYFTTQDGRQWLYGGETSVCNRYSVTGSISDRVCLSTEKVPLITQREHQARFCVFRSGDECLRYQAQTESYPLGMQVPIMRRLQETDSFSPDNIAFVKTVKVASCSDCAAKLAPYLKAR